MPAEKQWVGRKSGQLDIFANEPDQRKGEVKSDGFRAVVHANRIAVHPTAKEQDNGTQPSPIRHGEANACANGMCLAIAV